MSDATVDRKPLPIGKSFFDKVIEEGCYYVDKTLFVKDLIDKNAEVTLCTRPRRFGKTLNQTMIKCFFEDTAPIGGKDTRALFRGLLIEKAGERYMERQGKYPVIFLSFKEAKFDSFDKAYDKLRDCIALEFERHAYAAEKISSEYDRNLFKKLSNRAGSIGDYSTSLKFLSKCLEEHHGKRAVILIDEYDVPLENSWSCPNRFYDEMINFIRPLLSSAFKDNQHLQTGVITGCLRISKESIFTGLNNLDTASVLDDYYSEYFGFTQREVDAMLDCYGLDSKKQLVRDWYNGYLFGNTEVYNPWSCLKAIASWIKNINELPRAHWVNTSSNAVIHDMIDNMNAEAKAGLETLMSGGTVSSVVDEYVTYGDIYATADNLWNFLLFTGYLKKARESVDRIERVVLDMKIPNKELYIIFETKIQEWFNKRVAREDTAAFLKAIIDGNTEIFQKELSMLLVESISYMDSKENNYHGFMTGVLTILARQNGYLVKSNRESGDGRSDLVLYNENGNDATAVIFEFKVAPNAKMLATVCEDALKQIEEKNYAAYWDEEDYKNIIKYGIGFYKKRCAVKKGL
ncbi:hypothetical protein R80B4_01144 [Fibrobacteres bacterium R8-0-B4]